jgi:two-component system, chemotaxis family, CheB/CheR fusion protein
MKWDNTLTKMNSDTSYPFVGIGASAGGLDALQRFLSVLPKNFDFALIFIQHLSSQHKSLLQELLSARLPSLVIQEISDGLKAQIGRLYLSPPGKEVRLRKGLFQTTVHTEGLIHLPIDEFLTSLAADAGDRSIAVIFSGAGTDGARGCQAVRASGGMVFVQDPQTAEFNSMPLAAIATGQADAVLAPEDIAAELLKLQGTVQATVNREYAIIPEEFDAFFRILQEKTGSRFKNYKKSVVSRRIRRRMYLQGLSTVKDYLDLITTNDTEAAHLASDLMIGVTSFFRDQVAWKALHLEAVRKITSENTNLPIRVWTPASATGEEAYSIAMMLLRELTLVGKKRDIQVFASDVNDHALDHAREGKYAASITADVPQEYVQKYFSSTDDGNFLIINKDVRECVVFAKQDLLNDPPFSKLDLIICRNFLIYLEPEAQEKSITLFHYALKEGGYLFLGNAETVGRKSSLFKSIGHKQCRIYRKLETKHVSRLPISVPYATERQVSTAKQAQTTEQPRSIMEIIQEKLLEGYGPAAVAIDQNYEIIYHNGPTKQYLSQPRGVPTQNLLVLLPESLRSRVRGAIYQSGREERPVVIRTNVADDDNCKRQISLQITKAQENLYIVVFQEKGVSSKEEITEQVDATVIEETAIHQLESELTATRADLQSHIEQLKSINEEFQSSNEELQASNEELETSREELQSLNEELITVNSQLQGKIEEQDTTNNDLNNFQASTNIPMIFLDMHFHVKRFTPAMLKLIKLLPSDVGRPIVDMSQENLGPELTSDAQSVLKELMPMRREHEISGIWYVRTILPYRTANNRIEGVVVTYNDVTELKRAEEQFRTLADSIPNLAWWANGDGYITWYNRRWYDYTGTTPEQMEGWGWQSVHDPKVLPMVLERWRTSIATGEPFDMEFPLRGSDGVFRPFLTRVMPLKDSTGLVLRWFGTNTDISTMKQAEEAVRESEARYRGLFENMIEGFAYCKMIFENGKPQDFIYLSVNHAFETLTGLKNVVGKRVTVVIPGIQDADPGLFEIYGRVSLTGKPERFEMFVEALKMWFSISVYSPEKEFFVAVFDVITERKKAEEAQGQLAAIVESAEDAVIGKDLNGIIQTWNVGAENIFGYKAEEVIGKPISLLIPQGHHDEVPEILARIKRGEHIENFETVRMRKDGTIVPVSLKFSAIRDRSGKVIGASKIAHDITARKRAEEALALSNQKLAQILDSIQEHFYALDRNWNFTYAGRNFATRLGKQPEDYIGRNFWEIFPQLLGTISEENMRAAMDNRETRRFEVHGTYTDAAWYNMTCFPSSEGISVLGMDITERKQSEEALQESEARFRSVLENSLDCIYRFNLQTGRYEYISPAAQNILGLLPNELIAQDIETAIAMIHPDDVPILRTMLARLDKTDKEEVEYRQRTKSGDYCWISNRTSLVRDSAGRPLYRDGNIRDITERKRSEEALQESEAKYRNLFANMVEEVHFWKLVRDEQGRIKTWRLVDANPPALKTWGKTLKEIKGRTTDEIFGPGATDHYLPVVQKIVTEGVPYSFEDYFPHLDKYFQFVSVPLGDYFITTGADITNIKKIQEQLQEAQRIAHIGSWFWDAKTDITTGSDELLRIYGFDPATQSMPNFADQKGQCYPTEDWERVNAAVQKTLQTGIGYELDVHAIRNNALIWVTTRSEAVRDTEGRTTGLRGTVQDITERKLAEEALRAQAALLNLAHDAIIVRGTGDEITFWNRGAEETYGWTCEEVVGRATHELLMTRFPKPLVELNAEIAKKGKWEGELINTRKDGQVIVVASRWAAQRDVSGLQIGVLEINRDITARKKAEADILKLSKDLTAQNIELEFANKEMESFVYSVSHDLRAPLRVMSGFSKMLIEDFGSKLEEQPKDHLRRIMNASEKMTGLIEDLLRLSRISKQDMARMDYDLSRLASSIAAGLHEGNPVRSVEFAITEGLRVSVDPNLIKIALANLIENAWKFTSKTTNARIEFGAFEKDGKTVYYVRDNGAGFDPAYAEKMFLPFQRLHTEKEFEGTGIGLAIVERIIRRHGGAVWAEGEVGKGATVYFTLGV